MMRLSEVLALVPLSRNELYRRMNARLFPWPAPLSEGARRWARHEVNAWIHDHLLVSLEQHRKRAGSGYPPLPV